MARCPVDQLDTPAGEERVEADEDGVDILKRCFIDVPALIDMREMLFAEADHRLRTMINDAKASGMLIQDMRPLPVDLSLSALALPPKLWPQAAELTEGRRMTDALEEGVRVVVERSEPQAEILPDGRKFLASARLLKELRFELNGPVQGSGLGA
jgi:hypothetical protein